MSDTLNARVETYLRAASIPVTGVRCGDVNDRATWKVEPRILGRAPTAAEIQTARAEWIAIYRTL